MAPLIYNGTTITAVVYNGTNLSSLVYNGTTVWQSGATYAILYGGQGSATYSYSDIFKKYDQMLTLLSNSGTIGSLSGISIGGASIGATGLYYGGYNGYNAAHNKLTRTDVNMNQVGSINNIGTATNGGAGVGFDSTAVFNGNAGTSNGLLPHTGQTDVVNSSGALVVSETFVGPSVGDKAAALTGGIGLYAGGNFAQKLGSPISNVILRLNSNGTQYGSQTTLSSTSNGYYGWGGATVGGNAFLFGGSYGSTSSNNYGTVCNHLHVYNSSATLVYGIASLGTANAFNGGASLSAGGAYFNGNNGRNILINSSYALVRDVASTQFSGYVASYAGVASL